MRRPGLAVLGIAAYAVFLGALMPARVVATRVEQATRGAVQLANVEGTLWKGRARVVVATPLGPADIEALQWRLLPARLLEGRVAYALHAPGRAVELSGEVGRSPAAWHVPALGAAATAQGLQALAPLLAPWRPEGEVRLEAKDLRWTDTALEGTAALEWRGAALGLSAVRPLGSYRAELRGEGAAARLGLATLEGPLVVTGRGTLTPPSRLAFTGEARAEGPAAAELKPILDLLGPARADGARAIQVVVNPP